MITDDKLWMIMGKFQGIKMVSEQCLYYIKLFLNLLAVSEPDVMCVGNMLTIFYPVQFKFILPIQMMEGILDAQIPSSNDFCTREYVLNIRDE